MGGGNTSAVDIVNIFKENRSKHFVRCSVGFFLFVTILSMCFVLFCFYFSWNNLVDILNHISLLL